MSRKKETNTQVGPITAQVMKYYIVLEIDLYCGVFLCE